MLRRKLSGFLKIGLMQPLGRLPKKLGLTVDGVDYNIRKLKKDGQIIRIGGDKGTD